MSRGASVAWAVQNGPAFHARRPRQLAGRVGERFSFRRIVAGEEIIERGVMPTEVQASLITHRVCGQTKNAASCSKER